MLKTTTDHYLLSPILDHKEKYDLGGTEIYIAKDYENNLRSRNCQIGIVESVPDTNVLNLEVGDTVFVNHFTFHGDIGDNRSFELNQHVEHEGKLIFRVPARKIFFKYNDEVIEPVGDIVILEAIHSKTETTSGIELQETLFKDRGRVIFTNGDYEVGKVVYVERHALYALELKGKEYFKVFSDEIAGIEEGDIIIPTDGRVVLEDEEELKSSFLDLSMVKKSNTVKAKVIRKGKLALCDDWIQVGDTVLRGRDYGVKYKDQFIVPLADENIYGVLG